MIKKKLFNRKVGIMLLAVILCVAFTACGDDSENTGESGGAEEKQPVVTSETADDYNFSEKAEKYLDKIATEFPNRNLSDEGGVAKSENRHEAVKEWIVSELKAAGYDEESIELDEFKSKEASEGNKGANIVVTIPGSDESKQVIVGAHYDGDGVGDNGSGVALLLANACGIAKEEPHYTIKMIFFDGEENGLLGSSHYVKEMSKQEKENTLYMVNMDSLGFGDYCNIYGGVADKDDLSEVSKSGAYDFAMAKAKAIGLKTYGTKELDGYFAKNKKGPEIEDDAIYTNPWTNANQPPENFIVPSPATGDWSDHAPFKEAGIEYVYFEATNWYAKGDGGEDAYTGYFDTDRSDIGEKGMFMNTKYDTLDDLNKYFPGRVKKHFDVYSPLLSGMMLDAGETVDAE